MCEGDWVLLLVLEDRIDQFLVTNRLFRLSKPTILNPGRGPDGAGSDRVAGICPDLNADILKTNLLLDVPDSYQDRVKLCCLVGTLLTGKGLANVSEFTVRKMNANSSDRFGSSIVFTRSVSVH